MGGDEIVHREVGGGGGGGGVEEEFEERGRSEGGTRGEGVVGVGEDGGGIGGDLAVKFGVVYFRRSGSVGERERCTCLGGTHHETFTRN